MKKRKIFYFLKTKEEYDYMLANGLIPKRGIVLIASTQEIYRDKVPYSGYGPLKTYFDLVRTDLLSLIQDKAEDVSSMVELIDAKLLRDVSDYNELFLVKLDELQTLISKNKTDISTLSYYISNTIVPSLKETKDNTESLDNKYTQVLSDVGSSLAIVNLFRSTLEGLISNVLEFKSTYNSELASIRSSMLTISNSSSSDVVSEAKIRNIVKEYQLSNTDFAAKVRVTVDPLLSTLKNEINASVNSKIAEISGNTGSGSNSGSSYQTATAYADSLFNIHASKLQFGTVKLGAYLRIDTNETLTIDISSLKLALNLSSGSGSSSELTSSELDSIKSRLNVIEATINIDQLKKDILNYINAATIVPTIDYTLLYTLSGFIMSIKNVLRNLNILDATGNYPLSSIGYTGTKNGLVFVNGLCTGSDNSGGEIYDDTEIPSSGGGHGLPSNPI